MRLKILCGLFLAVFCMSLQAAEGHTGWRTLTSFGCHLNDGTCYFSVDGAAVGPAECLKTNIRFNTKTSVNGDTWSSMILAAHLANKRVQFYITGCYGSYPTFAYGQIEQS